MQTAKWMLKAGLAAVAVAAPWAALAEGLKPSSDSLPWARWQARIAVGAPVSTWRAGLDSPDRMGLKVSGVNLMGDYYFSRSLSMSGFASGFRATSGLYVGPRSAATRPGAFASTGAFSVERRFYDTPTGLAGDTTAEGITLPYVGVGYSGLSLRGGWSFSADLGLMALTPANAVKLGRGGSGTPGLEELMRDLRLSPVIQFGVSYSF